MKPKTKPKPKKRNRKIETKQNEVHTSVPSRPAPSRPIPLYILHTSVSLLPGYLCAADFLRSLFSSGSGSRRRGLLEDVLKVLVWSFFAERLVQSALVGWGQSGRVGPLEQVRYLGGPLI